MLALALVLLAAPPAHAVGWVDGGPLSPPNRIAGDPQLAVTPTGERVMAWVQRLPGGRNPVENISVRIAPPGGAFGATQTFNGPFDGPQLAAGADGTVALSWLDTTTRTIHVARHAPGEPGFTEATPVVVPGGEEPTTLQVVESDGAAMVAFASAAQNSSSIWVASLARGGNALQLAPSGALDHVSFAANQPAVSVDRPTIAVEGGSVYVAWDQATAGAAASPDTFTAKLAKAPVGSLSFGPPAPVDVVTTRFVISTAPQLAAGGGHVYLVWQSANQNTSVVDYQDLVGDRTTRTIPTDSFFGDVQVGADAAGELIVAGDGIPRGLNFHSAAVATIAPGVPAAPAMRLTRPGINRELDALAVASDGTSVALPDRIIDNLNQTVQILAAVRLPVGAFGTPEDVTGIQDGSANGDHVAAAAATPGGGALVLWTEADHSGAVNERLHLSERDATPPAFRAVTIPGATKVGDRTGFSAAANDALTGNTTISWDFGDGSQADGAAVSHVFGAPGASTVTVTATDAVGNTVSLTRTVSVWPAGSTDHKAPMISRLRLSHNRFAVARGSTAVLARARRGAPIGTVLQMSISKRSTAVIAIRARNRIARGTLVRTKLGPGAVRIAFTGRIAGAALAPGSYTATVIAIDGAGNRSRPVSVRFTVVKR
jgi:PKD domain